jgi:hypothetical protein
MTLRTGSLTIVCGVFCNFLIHLFAPTFLGPAEALPVPASGQSPRFAYSAHPINWYAETPRPVRVRVERPRRERAAPAGHRADLRGYDHYRSPDSAAREVECRRPVRGLGTQWIGEEGALDAAKKDWMERVRYDHGESFLDMGNAKDAVATCGRVSIGEAMGQVMYRCEIVARPCQGEPRETELKTK